MNRRILLLAFVFVVGCDESVVAPAGLGGIANVRALNVVFSLENATFNETVASEKFEVPAVTPSVVDRGAVLVYFRDQGTWTALPFTIGIESSEMPVVDYTFTIGYGYDDSLVEIFVEASTADSLVWEDIVSILPQSYVMKIVVIDGFAADEHQDLDLSDYQAVEEYFSLAE